MLRLNIGALPTLTIFILLGASAHALADVPELPHVGQVAPGFSLPNAADSVVNIERLRGRWVVLYFYPKDFTGGCTLEARNFQADSASYDSLNAVVVGVSLDSVGSHREFCVKEGLGFQLLSDADGNVAAQYGSLIERGDRKVAARNTFLIDPRGRIVRVFAGVNPANHSAEVLAALRGARE